MGEKCEPGCLEEEGGKNQDARNDAPRSALCQRELASASARTLDGEEEVRRVHVGGREEREGETGRRPRRAKNKEREAVTLEQEQQLPAKRFIHRLELPTRRRD